MVIRFHPHALERIKERGATEAEVRTAVEQGEHFPVKYGRTGFRRNFAFNADWRGKPYRTKQVEVFAIQEDGDWFVITVITRYF